MIKVDSNDFPRYQLDKHDIEVHLIRNVTQNYSDTHRFSVTLKLAKSAETQLNAAGYFLISRHLCKWSGFMEDTAIRLVAATKAIKSFNPVIDLVDTANNSQNYFAYATPIIRSYQIEPGLAVIGY